MWLENRRKFYYMGHKRWCLEDHPYRYDDVGFDGNMEFGRALKPTSGSDVLKELEGTTFTYGKGDAQNTDIDEKDEQ